MLPVSQRVMVSQRVPLPAPPAKAPVVVTANQVPSGAKSTSRMKVSKTEAQLFLAWLNRSVDQLDNEAWPAAGRSTTAICSRG